jgi:hypothetical protein
MRKRVDITIASTGLGALKPGPTDVYLEAQAPRQLSEMLEGRSAQGNMKQTIVYLITITSIYFTAFLVAHLITKKMQSLRVKKEAELLHSSEYIDNEVINKNSYSNDVLNSYQKKQDQNEKFCFYSSIIIIIAFAVLVLIAFITDGKSFNFKFLKYIYYGLPIIGFYIIDDGLNYYRKHFRK